MATHSSVLTLRILGMAEPGGLPSIELQMVGHDWSNLAAAGAYLYNYTPVKKKKKKNNAYFTVVVQYMNNFWKTIFGSIMILHAMHKIQYVESQGIFLVKIKFSLFLHFS